MAASYDKKKGISMMLLSALCFSLMNVFSRLAGEVPVVQRTFFRNLITAVVVFLIMGKKGLPRSIKKGTLGDHLVRATLGIVSMIGNFYAVDHMMLSDSTMILELNPFFAILMSVFILKERPTAKQLGCVLLALVGAMFVVKPSAALFTGGSAALIALASSLMGGTAYTIVRKLTGRGENGMMVILFFSIFSCFFCLPWMVMDYVAMNIREILLILAMSAMGCGAQFAVTAAYSHAPAAEISIFDYSQLIFAAVLGWIIFEQLADGWSYVGYAVIFSAAAVMFFGNRKSAAASS